MYKITQIFKIIIGLIIVLLVLSLLFIGYWNPQTKTITVKDKYIKTETSQSKNGSFIKDTYMIVDTDNNAYKVTDLFWMFKFNSTDIYNSLDINKTYTIKTTGFRIPFFSAYPNINKVQLLEEN